MSSVARTAARVIAVVALAGLALAACGGDDASTPAVYTRSASTISVRVGEEFVIRLASNPTTGFEWSATETAPEVRLVSKRYDGPSVQIPGRGGHQEFRFEARSKGRATIELANARSFEPDVPSAETATFALRIR